MAGYDFPSAVFGAWRYRNQSKTTQLGVKAQVCQNRWDLGLDLEKTFGCVGQYRCIIGSKRLNQGYSSCAFRLAAGAPLSSRLGVEELVRSQNLIEFDVRFQQADMANVRL